MIRAFLIGTVSSMALASAAFAADLPNTKAEAPYIPPPPPEFSWTGFYIGGNAGLSGGDFNKNNFLSYYEISESYTDDYGHSATSRGFSGGGQIGYNYQWPATNFVVGLEADFQGSTLTGTYFNATIGDGSGPVAGVKGQSQVDWWGTVRGRLGYAFGNILPYATGGFAYGRVDNSFDAWADSSTYSYSYGGTQTGWTAGAGVEYALTHNLTLKVEYLYTQLGGLDRYNSWTCDVDHSCSASDSTKTTFSTVRAGLNWKFDWMAPFVPAPVVAKY